MASMPPMDMIVLDNRICQSKKTFIAWSCSYKESTDDRLCHVQLRIMSASVMRPVGACNTASKHVLGG